MARRRYISTKISQDSKINKLAMTAGDFAAMLYTWLIPHAEDDARVSGNTEEIMMMVIPGRRDKTSEEVEYALAAMHDLGLVVWNRDEHYIEFPPEKFYSYQSYIKDQRRKTAQHAPSAPISAQNTEHQRKTPQNAASFSFRSSFSSPSPVISPSDDDDDDPPTHVRAREADAFADAYAVDPPSPPVSSSPSSSKILLADDGLTQRVEVAANLASAGMRAIVQTYALRLQAAGKDIVAEATCFREKYEGSGRTLTSEAFKNWCANALKPERNPPAPVVARSNGRDGTYSKEATDRTLALYRRKQSG
jgi:hypothetical protein